MFISLLQCKRSHGWVILETKIEIKNYTKIEKLYNHTTKPLRNKIELDENRNIWNQINFWEFLLHITWLILLKLRRDIQLTLFKQTAFCALSTHLERLISEQSKYHGWPRLKGTQLYSKSSLLIKYSLTFYLFPR